LRILVQWYAILLNAFQHHTSNRLAPIAPNHDPQALRQRLQDKEAQVARNRLKELNKVKAKVELQQRHARMVVERKRALAESSTGQQIGGGLKQAAGFRSSKGVDDTDSGLGGFSRGGSGSSVIGRSTLELNIL
jgi:hypothetical protein